MSGSEKRGKPGFHSQHFQETTSDEQLFDRHWRVWFLRKASSGLHLTKFTTNSGHNPGLLHKSHCSLHLSITSLIELPFSFLLAFSNSIPIPPTISSYLSTSAWSLVIMGCLIFGMLGKHCVWLSGLVRLVGSVCFCDSHVDFLALGYISVGTALSFRALLTLVTTFPERPLLTLSLFLSEMSQRRFL